ncbi:DUF6927 domain-containing protein [Burkholderia cenocepacia]|uniref:DUF6927 domain-containing protein n=1 Tax=Burkholderia cenocepacia TaxID=95486 RepID=UPI000760C0CD|nr:hypothetical protein [Burkholderia cenocepacia]KWU26371.1 hypothetical protein AS149_25620 [Burkholderia cenocepacia]
MGYSAVRNVPGTTAIEMLAKCSSYRVGKTWGDDKNQYEVISLAPGRGGVYGVIRWTVVATGQQFNFALVVLVTRSKGEFCWKEMSEFSGPCEVFMPKALFRRLSPLDELPESESPANAAAWREEVRKHLERAEFKPQVGDELHFSSPIPFQLESGPVEVTRFEIMEWGKRRRFIAHATDGSRFNARLHRRVYHNIPHTFVRP